MTEIERYEPQSQVAVSDPTGGRLVAWAAAAAAANQLAKALSRTSFVPAAFKGNEYDATAAIIMGDEVGLSPLAALRSIYVVHGTPAMYARTMVALVQSRGHEVWTELSTDAKVVVCGRRKGSDKVEHSEWTTARAQKAGYTTNKKYATNAQEMLYSKASAEICRKVGADVLLGIPFSIEDLELEQPAPTTTASRTTERKTTAKRATLVAEEPDFEPSGMDEFAKPAEDAPAETGEALSTQQSKLLHKLLNDNDLGDRDAGLAYIGGVIGREIATSKDLTKAEASIVIDRLSSMDNDDKEPTQAVLDEIAAGK
jgi:hypothetical protein